MYITLIYQLRCNQIITLCKNKLKLSMYQSQCLSTTNCTNMIHQNYHEVIKDKKQFKSKEAYRLYLLKLDSEYQELLHQAFNKSCFNSLPLDLRETGYHDHLIKYFNTILEPKIENVNSISMEDPHSNNSNQNKVNIVDPFNPEYFVEGVKIYKSLYGDPWIHRNFKIDENDMNWPYHFRGFPLGRYVRIYRELRESKIYNERQLVNTGIQDELDKLHYIPSLKMTTFVLTITNILVYKELYGNYSVHNQFYIPNSKFYPIDDNKYIHNPFPKYSWGCYIGPVIKHLHSIPVSFTNYVLKNAVNQTYVPYTKKHWVLQGNPYNLFNGPHQSLLGSSKIELEVRWKNILSSMKN